MCIYYLLLNLYSITKVSVSTLDTTISVSTLDTTIYVSTTLDTTISVSIYTGYYNICIYLHWILPYMYLSTLDTTIYIYLSILDTTKYVSIYTG